MKLSAAEDIDRPAAEVFARVADVDAFEAALRTRGVPVTRLPGPVPPEIGATWTGSVEWRGRRHGGTATLVSVEPESGYAIEGEVGGITAMGVVDLLPLGPERTRLLISVDLAPTTLTSRVLLQSLKLARGAIADRFKTRVAGLAESIRRG